MENQTTNDKLLSLFEDYKKLNARYEETNYNTVAIRERKVLSEIMKVAKERRLEIQETRKDK